MEPPPTPRRPLRARPPTSESERRVFGRIDWRSARRFGLTFGVSAAGGLIAQLLGLPAGWIAGGVLAVAAASLAGLNTEVPRPLHPPVFLVIGVYAGGGVSQETLHQMATWPASFAILGVSVVGVIASSYWWLHGRSGWDRNSAMLASLPGALSLVMATAEDLKADLKKVAIAQSLRLLILVEVIPLAALLIGHPAGGPAAGSVATASLRDVLIMFVVGVAAGLVFRWLKVPAGWMMGGLFASASLLLGGVVGGRLPFGVVLPFVIALAAITGSRVRPGDMAILPRIAKPSLVAFGLAGLVSLVSAVSVTLLLGVNIIQTLLAFAPGALDALIIIAFQMNIDPAYVAAHHVARFLGLVVCVPILARWLARRSKSTTKSGTGFPPSGVRFGGRTSSKGCEIEPPSVTNGVALAAGGREDLGAAGDVLHRGGAFQRQVERVPGLHQRRRRAASISRSSWIGVGVIRSRSVPRGTVG